MKAKTKIIALVVAVLAAFPLTPEPSDSRKAKNDIAKFFANKNQKYIDLDDDMDFRSFEDSEYTLFENRQDALFQKIGGGGIINSCIEA